MRYEDMPKGRNKDRCVRCGKRYNFADKALSKAKVPYDLLCLAEVTTSGYMTHGNVKLCDECMVELLMWLDRKTESNSEKPNNCEHITEDGVTCAKYPACDDCLDNPLNKVKGSERLVKGSEKTDCLDRYDRKTEPSFKVDEIGDDDPTIHAIAYLQKVGWLQEHDRALTEQTEPQIYGNEHNCIMTIFGECSYKETGCGDCAVVEKVRKALKQTEPNCSEKPNNCEPQTEDWQDWKDKMWAEAIVTEPKSCKTCKHDSNKWYELPCETCCGYRHYEPKTEPQTDTEIAKAIVHKMIDDAVIAEDAYPDLRQKMHDAVDEYEPQTERSE